MSIATRSQVVSMSSKGYTLSKIKKHLNIEGVDVSKKSLCLLLRKYRKTGSVADHRTIPARRKLKDEHYRFIDERMAENDQLTALKLFSLLKGAYPEVNVSVSTVKRVRMDLGWTAKKTRYGAMISTNNQEKRVEWCQELVNNDDMDFQNDIFTDECHHNQGI